jgi:hypothetical protein
MPMMLSLHARYLFVADKPCLIEQLPPSMHLEECVQNMRVIAGTFDISKWFRPVESSFEVVDPTKVLRIRRGDPLFYVRLVPQDGTVTLKHEEYSDEMRAEVFKCTSVKRTMRNLPLKALYELGTRIKKGVFKCTL